MRHLFKTKGLSRLTYALDVIPLNIRQLKSLNFVIIGCHVTLFKTKSMDIINDCISYFELPDIKTIIDTRHIYLYYI